MTEHIHLALLPLYSSITECQVYLYLLSYETFRMFLPGSLCFVVRETLSKIF